MKLTQTPRGILLEDADGLSLEDTFTCGQCFRWETGEASSFHGVAFGRYLKIIQHPDGSLLFEGMDEKEFLSVWFPYFDLGRDYALIRRELSLRDPQLAAACRNAPGIRILRQEPWEALCSFIISQNNNIPRIKGIIERFCHCFGQSAGGGLASFPPPDVVAGLTVEDLAPLRCGFRAKYLLDAADKVASGKIHLEELVRAPIEEARASLMTILGVGPKVAECALIYGMGRMDAFPMDVWMKRAMALLFPGRTPEFFSPYAGIAQQYLFHYCRQNKILTAEDARRAV